MDILVNKNNTMLERMTDLSFEERRVEFIEEIKQNGKTQTWNEYAEQYGFRDGKQANDYWRYHLDNPEYYAPGILINPPSTSEFQEQIQQSIKETDEITEIAEKALQEYDNLTLKSQWEVQGKGGKVKVLRSWTNSTRGEDIKRFKEDLVDKIKRYSPERSFKVAPFSTSSKLAEISFPDFHIGRVSVEVSKDLYENIIKKTLQRLSDKDLDQIVYVIGNDWLNVDSSDYSTTKGTPQKDVDDFSTTMRAGVQIALDSVYALKTLGVPIHLIILPGNHDRFRMEAVGLALAGYFHNDEQVTIDNEPEYRKYFKYGQSGFMYEHGELKAKDYTPIFATEAKKLWGETEYHYVRCGHLHHNIEEEHPGTEVTFMPSLSEKSNWEDWRGYISHRRGFVYIHDKVEGEIERVQIKT